jgi:hypothetical protein
VRPVRQEFLIRDESRKFADSENVDLIETISPKRECHSRWSSVNALIINDNIF